MIGSAAGLMILLGGKVMGCSGIAGGNLHDLLARRPTTPWRWAFLVGVLTGAAVWRWRVGALPGQDVVLSPVAYGLGGLCVGFGTRLGSGCTSGHGVCGIPRASKRSLAAVALFFVVAMATVALVRQLPRLA